MSGEDRRDRNNLRILIVLLLIAAGIGGTAMVMQGLRRSNALQDCLMTGRSNCAPIQTSH
jgi:hypothetical protein